MGYWMWLSRYDGAEVAAVLDHPHGLDAGLKRLRDVWEDLPNDAGYDPSGSLCKLEEVDTHRTWEALHVLLTGLSDEHLEHDLGDPPAADVVLGGLVMGEGTIYRVPRLLRPDQVRAVDGFLRELDRDALIRERYAFLKEVRPYSFEGWGWPPSEDMVEHGVLATVFSTVRDFYARAAADGNAVIKEIG
ncbi:DUF1877 family protein [Actinomadura madurae]|uniref:DUF1877 family protein n=1 Tax=Actinomadura madurae TaxID=1993 RepID=UPI0020276580|nr:DUF1877 family protein [Actinomadura madurae]MCP9949889.1 YfbM family protein [Actinomadura madurae]MCP9966640.1 YfbM family protein [Actinomadura madurae]MCP9979129.1 YfbM family protein [Actinomadura madurae]MCQ0009340.1 YfbM family protein [Actinomadura madurae]MCQ0015319.1 YfbM family protein [Actinomadura madurae]